MDYVEEKDFTFRLEVRCAFPDDYEGESDGYAWTPELNALTGEMLAAIVATVQKRPGWRVRPANRGRATDEEITLVLERTMSATE